jgi:FKBP-type peptidyl-prolyl cis-trans isomerase
MKKTTSLLLGVLALLFIQACKQESFKKTKSGLLYKIISDGKGQLVKKGDFIKVNYEQKIHFARNNKDSLLGTSYNAMPTYAPIDSVGADYNPTEIFPMLRKGDSLVVMMMADSLERRSGQLPPFINKKDKITLHLKVIDILPSEEALRNDQQQLITAQKQKESDVLQDYISKNNIKATKLPSGVYYEIISQGTGPKADSGKLVSVLYTGYTLDGKPFDSNTDSTKQTENGKHPLVPFEFIAGVQGSIQGMLEGVQYFNKGGKGRLFIPSMLAYGSNPPPGAPFKPFSNLMFDIEVIDVKAAPAGGQQMPQF